MRSATVTLTLTFERELGGPAYEAEDRAIDEARGIAESVRRALATAHLDGDVDVDGVEVSR